MSYLDGFFKAPQQIVDTIVHELSNPMLGQVDAIVGRGVSGILPLMSVSVRTGIPALVVRKDGKNTHSDSSIEGMALCAKRYVIIDDLIDSGTTIKTILAALGYEQKCIGIVLYNGTNDERYSQFPGEIPVINIREDVDQLVKIHNLKKLPSLIES